MAEFLTRLRLELQGRKTWMTLTPFAYVSDVAQQTIVVPAEFITDLASVPRLPLAYLLAGDRAPGPAVVHDYLYQLPSWADRSLADAIFLEAMGVHQPELGFEAEGGVIRRLMWAAVRAGGWVPWRGHEKRAAELNPVWSDQGWPAESPQAA